MNFTKIYNQTINNLLLEGNLKQLSNLFQYNYLNGKSYSDLSKEDKVQLNNYIKDQKVVYLDYINSITDNPQFQSIIYDWLINKSIIFPEDIDKVKEIIQDYIQLTKRSDQNFQSISQFESYSDLFNYIQSYKKQSKIKSNLPFELIYQNNSYNIYQVNQDQYQQFNQYYGGNKDYYNTGWCVAKNQKYFDRYLKDDNDKYVLWTNKDNSPFALLHFDSNQFKDTSDKSLQDNCIDILDGLNFIVDKYNIDYNNFDDDLQYYKKQLWLYNNPNRTEVDWLVFKYNLIYNRDTDRYDCSNDLYCKYDLVKDGKFIIKFGNINGNFYCTRLDLITLENGPINVNGNFCCYINQLTSLLYGPKEVGGDFDCSDNQLTSLKYCPQTIKGYFDCSYNQLTSLQYCPKEIIGTFRCYNNHLTSLQYCPNIINKNFDCSYNQLTNLQYCPKVVNGKIVCSNNQINTLQYHPDIVKGTFYCSNNQLLELETKPNWIKGDLVQ